MDVGEFFWFAEIQIVYIFIVQLKFHGGTVGQKRGEGVPEICRIEGEGLYEDPILITTTLHVGLEGKKNKSKTSETLGTVYKTIPWWRYAS